MLAISTNGVFFLSQFFFLLTPLPERQLSSERRGLEGYNNEEAETSHTLLEVEFLYTRLIGGDGSALDTDGVLLDGLSGVEGDLVVGLVTVLEAEIVVLEVDVEVRVDELVLDVLPDDAGHLVPVELDDGVLDLDLASDRHGSSCSVVGEAAVSVVGESVVGRVVVVGGCGEGRSGCCSERGTSDTNTGRPGDDAEGVHGGRLWYV